MPDPYIKNILKANVYDLAIETPISFAQFLSKRLKNKIYVKREDLQPVFSFKLRGAYNKIKNLSDAEKKRGIIAASAGNHAQGVVMSATKLGIESTIVMPTTTPEIKVLSVKERGGHVILHGDSFDEALTYAKKLVEEKNYVFIHPYDDPEVIAGQGTVAMEILRQHSGTIDAIFIPVGGGGLAAGMAAYIKYLRPEIKVIGVESQESACLYEAMKSGERVILPEVGIFADGVAVSQIGEETFRLAQKFIDEVITVSVDDICAAIKDLFNDTRSIAEPAGALGLAGLKKYIEREGVENQTLLTIETGANINFDRLRFVSEHAGIGSNKEAIFAVRLPELMGNFKKLCKALEDHSITEFNYRYSDHQIADVFIGVELYSGPQERAALIENIEKEGFEVTDLTDNEAAKLHIRHMVGGHPEGECQDERIFLLEFPERKGTLMRFLDELNGRWNLSLFHYRSHGTIYGRVMIGLQIPEHEKEEVTQLFDKVGYRYKDDSDNIAYKQFLRKSV